MSFRWRGEFPSEPISQAVFTLIASNGITGATMRAVARQARMSVSGLSARYDGKADLLAVAARDIGLTHLADLEWNRTSISEPVEERLAGMVARNDQELTELRVWLELVAAGRTCPVIGEVTAHVDDCLRRLLLQVLAGPSHGVDADRAWLWWQAIRTEQARPGTTLDVERAGQLCAELVTALRS